LNIALRHLRYFVALHECLSFFARALAEHARVLGNGLARGTMLCPLANRRRVNAMKVVDDARRMGARKWLRAENAWAAPATSMR